MQIILPKPIAFIERNKRLYRRFTRFEGLIVELQSRDIPEDIIIEINNWIKKLNYAKETPRDFKKQLRISQREILNLLEKKISLIPTNHNFNKYTGIGIVLGIVLGTVFHNMSMSGLWLPMGLIFGMAYGNRLDKKAIEGDKVLDFELKY